MNNSLDDQALEELELISTKPDLADELPTSRQSGTYGTTSEDSEDSPFFDIFDTRPRSQDYSDLDPDDIEEEEKTKNGSPNLDPNWDGNYENIDMTDDPVRMYLREIDRVGLLKAADERTLARRIEAYKHVEVVETELKESQGTSPMTWMFVQQFLKSLCTLPAAT